MLDLADALTAFSVVPSNGDSSDVLPYDASKIFPDPSPQSTDPVLGGRRIHPKDRPDLCLQVISRSTADQSVVDV